MAAPYGMATVLPQLGPSSCSNADVGSYTCCFGRSVNSPCAAAACHFLRAGRGSSLAASSSRPGSFCAPKRRILRGARAESSNEENVGQRRRSEEAERDEKAPGPVKGMFSFVTDNPSSRSAIQLSATPAQDGNLGQMITSIEGKGRDFGRYVPDGRLTWFVRETGRRSSAQPPVVLLHGVPTQSYSFRVVMKQLADMGFNCFAPDWIGFGFSEKPQPKYDYAYTEDSYHESLDNLFSALEINQKMFLVVQGYVLGQYALTWALKNPDRIEKLAILNTPLTPSASLPSPLQQLRLPFVGEFASQNAVLPERFVEGSSRYVLDINDADVYRLPYLDSSDAGFAMLEVMRKASLKDIASRIKDGFSDGRWTVPTLVIWGEDDKYLPASEAASFVSANPKIISTNPVYGAGHMPQEDWPEKVVEALATLFTKR